MYGRVDILINNAGVSSRGSVMDTDTEVDRRIMELNFFGTISFTKGSYTVVAGYNGSYYSGMVTFETGCHKRGDPLIEDSNQYYSETCL